jgi:hypothetical protein
MIGNGSLGEYPVSWVLRQAARESFTGRIEFHSTTTVFIEDGQIALVSRDVGADGRPSRSGFQLSEPADERRSHREALALLSSLVAQANGSFEVHEAHQDGLVAAPFRWETSDLVDQASPPPPPALAEPPDRLVSALGGLRERWVLNEAAGQAMLRPLPPPPSGAEGTSWAPSPFGGAVSAHDVAVMTTEPASAAAPGDARGTSDDVAHTRRSALKRLIQALRPE